MSEESTKERRSRPLAELPPGCESLLSRVQVCAALGNVSMRKLDKLIASGEFPRADTPKVGTPRWRTETVNRWIREACGVKEVEAAA